VPIYDYACAACRHRFEVFHGVNESGPRQCPLCGGQVSRAFAPPTILFKGSGWAKVDRRSASTAHRRAGSEPSDGSGASGTPSTGASTAPDTSGSATSEPSTTRPGG
jgi:putative FmdB family regulatory protein